MKNQTKTEYLVTHNNLENRFDDYVVALHYFNRVKEKEERAQLVHHISQVNHRGNK